MNNGELTATVARTLSGKFKSRADILFDHGNAKIDSPDKVGTIHAWFGDALKRDTLLADLDIAVLLPRGNRALLLIEVEESSARPKTVLGDVFAALLAEHFTFQGKRNLETGNAATLIVYTHGDTRRPVLDFISNKLANTRSVHFCRVVLDTFRDQQDLESKLTRQIEQALAIRHSEF